MNAIKNGGPAFPHTKRWVAEDLAEYLTDGGMSLRDWFAGQALAGHLASMNPGSFTRDECDHAALQSYWFADAMLAAREAKS